MEGREGKAPIRGGNFISLQGKGRVRALAKEDNVGVPDGTLSLGLNKRNGS